MLQIGKGAWHLSAAHIPEMNLQKKKKKSFVYYTSKCWAKCLKSKTIMKMMIFNLFGGTPF